MRKLVDLTGQKFSKLTVLRREGCKGPYPAWRCKCDCGNETVVRGTSLKRGNTKSCGCLQHERKRLKPNNKAICKGDYYEVYNDNGDYFLIDKKDYNSISIYRWNKDSLGYWVTSINGQTTRLHKFLFPNTEDIIDHKDRNKNNNRRNNLRIATRSQNSTNCNKQSNNTSGIIGVSFDKSNRKWYAYLSKEHKHLFLGRYNSLKDAIIVRLKAEKEYFGEFAPQRHLFEKYGI